MASSQSPNRVYFTNFDRSVNDSNTDFTVTFDTPIQNAYNFEVVSASFPNLFKSCAPYETILYFYHEDFDAGATAIGVPMSTTLAVGGSAGDSTAVTGREAYIDKRYFADGTDLATYLTNWLASYSTNFPASSTGLCPFYYPNDDPTQPPVFFANEAATGVTFSNLSFTFDDLTTNGTLKMTFADSTPKSVRVASILDFGSLTAGFAYPSQLGFKLGFTALEYAAFNTTVNITPSNNQFYVNVNQGFFLVNIPVNDYSPAALAAELQSLILGLNVQGVSFAGTTVTESSGTLTFNLQATGGIAVAGVPLGVFFNQNAITQATGTSLGFTTFTFNGGVCPSASFSGQTTVVVQGTVSPDDHVAPDTINLIRTASVYIASSLSSGESLASAGRKDILFKVPLTAGIGDVQLYQSSLSGIVINRPPAAIRNLRVTFLDDNFQVMEPLPQNAPISVEIHFAYNEDAKANQIDRASTNVYS